MIIAYVSVCKKCGAIGGASGSESGPLSSPGDTFGGSHYCSVIGDRSHMSHWMILVPVVVPVELA